MDKEEFSRLRQKLDKTQKKLAQLLGTSVKAVHSYEQGWRRIPVHVERHLFFLVHQLKADKQPSLPCWKVLACPAERRAKCPAWEYKTGSLCWFINGTVCNGRVQDDWHQKMAICRSCEVFQSLLS